MEVELRARRKSKKYLYFSKCVLFKSLHSTRHVALALIWKGIFFSLQHLHWKMKWQLFLQMTRLHTLPGKEQSLIHHCTTWSQCIQINALICNSFSHHSFCKLISFTAHTTFKLLTFPPKQNSLPDLCPANKPTLLSSATRGIKEKTQRSETYLNSQAFETLSNYFRHVAS